MEKELSKELDNIVDYIVNSKEYKECIKYKEEMDKDNNLTELINNIKKLQKQYINSNDKDIKDRLDNSIDELNNNYLYSKYNQNLEIVNNMINYVKDELNDYFDKLLNENTNSN